MPHFSVDLSSDFCKKVGDFIKKGSESLDFTGLKIPRDYIYDMEVTSEHDIPLIVK